MSALTLPCDLAAERAVLGAILLDRDAIVTVADWLQPEHFYLARHELMYGAMLACLRRREPPDLVTVVGELRRQNALDAAGGMSALGELLEETATAVHVAYYAQAVGDTAAARRLVQTGGEISALGYDERRPLAERQAAAERLLFGATQGGQGGDFTPAAALAGRVLDYLGSDEEPAISTGLRDLDRRILGWRPARLYVVAGRPKMGKTGFACATVARACQAGRRVAMYSLEMAGEELIVRIVSGLTGVDSQRIEAKRLSQHEYALVVDALAQINTWDLLVGERPDESITTIRARARRAHTERPLDLVVVDYLQLAEGDGGPGAKRHEQVASVARGLKKLARELRVPVLAPAQLNREVEGRATKVPLLADLRESGEIEQAADAVMFLVRPEYYDPADRPGVAEIHIAAQRGGPSGVMVECRFDGPSTFWHDLSRYDNPEGY